MTAPIRQPAPGDWLRAYARVQVVADAEIVAILREAQTRVMADMNRILGKPVQTVSDTIKYQQMAMIRKAILEEQSRALRRVGKVTEARRLEAAAQAIKLSGALDAYILQKLGQQAAVAEILAGLTRGLAQTTEVALARMELSYTALSQRIYQVDVWLGSRIDRQITAALARGLTAREFAAEARDWFDPSTPGGVRYAAMRLARSEINNAFHAVSVQQVQDKPWVHAMSWHLSGSHPKADICDEYAHEDKFDLGPGVFPKAQVPRKPHPHCFCYVTPEQIDEDDFLDQLVGGGFDDYLEGRRALAAQAAPQVAPPAIPRRGRVAR